MTNYQPSNGYLDINTDRIDTRGLSESEVSASRAAHGANTLTAGRKKSFIRRFFSNMNDPVIRILIGALIINIIFTFRGGDPVECIGIAISVFLATFISTLSEHGSEAAFGRLSASSGGSCNVRREGRLCNIPTEQVVVGDILSLGAGDKIPADALLIKGKLMLDQSAMTGEGREIAKIPSKTNKMTPSSPSSLLRGCAVMSGEGEAVVVAVGDATALGEISREIQSEVRQSPLKLRLGKLAKQISILGYIAAALISLLYLADTLLAESGFRWELIADKLTNLPFMAETLLHALTLGLTVIVVAVPEGLPMMIAVVLSANIRKMLRANVLVRKPVGIEAAGSMNILFTDKTGTLTEGRMSLSSLCLGDGTAFGSISELRGAGSGIFEHISLAATLNNASESGAEGEIVGGNATDRALLSAFGAPPPLRGLAVSRRIPFDSAKKFSAVRLSSGRTLIKGAPELILRKANKFLTADGTCKAGAGGAERFIAEANKNGRRTIALAEGSEGLTPDRWGALTLIAVISLEDPLRAEAGDAVSRLRGAGIGVVMITGDSLETARSVGGRCGIVGEGRDICIDSEQMAAMSDAKLSSLLPRLALVARALPSDKSRLVRLAEEAGLVVGMTGDGINDAPALRRADVGFAMGSGTQVARDAGDIIILDNNLASVGNAVLFGRNIFKSIRKFITLQLTMNFCAVGVCMIAPFLGVDSPVTVIQMLWINIIMDTLGGLAFAGEAALPDIMQERPKRRDQPILNSYMVNQIVFLGGFTVCLCLAFLKLPVLRELYRASEGDIVLLTAFFALFIFSSVANCFNSRTDRLKLFAGLGKNRAFLAIMTAVAAVQTAFVYLGGSLLRTVPLSPRELLVTLLISLSVFPAELLRKLLWRFFVGKKGY